MAKDLLVCDVAGKCKFRPNNNRNVIKEITQVILGDEDESGKGQKNSTIPIVPIYKGVAHLNGEASNNQATETATATETTLERKNITITKVPVIPGAKDVNSLPSWFPTEADLKPLRPSDQDLRPLIDFYIHEHFPDVYPNQQGLRPPPRPTIPYPQQQPQQPGIPHHHYIHQQPQYPLPYGPHLHRPSYPPPKNVHRPVVIYCTTSPHVPSYDDYAPGQNGIQGLVPSYPWQFHPPNNHHPQQPLVPPQTWYPKPPLKPTPCPPTSNGHNNGNGNDKGKGNGGAVVKGVKAKSDVASLLKEADERADTLQGRSNTRYSITLP